MRPLRSQKTPNVSEKEHFVTIEMLQDSGEQYNWHLLHELVCTGRTKWLGAGDQKAPRVTHESQRLLMPGEPSKWANPPRCAHVSGDPLSAGKSEDGEMPEEKNQWCALQDASYHHNVSATTVHGNHQYSQPIRHVHVRHLHCTSYPGAC